jgi:hypothetical protein
MNDDRTIYRRMRLLTGGVTPVLLAGALLAFALVRGGAWDPGVQVAGICRELIAGTTEGRQALFGSCWVAPLPVLVYLPFAWLLPEPAAGWAALFAAWLFAFWSVREAVKAAGQPGWRVVLAQAALAGMMLLARQPQVWRLAVPLTAGLTLLTAAALADWAAFRRLRDAVAAGASAAFLLLCGFPFFVLAGAAVALVPLAACGDRETRKRFPAWLLLAWLPLLYTLGVWLLMNRLVLGDALFFLRSLPALVPDIGRFAGALLASAAWLLPALFLTWGLDARRAGAVWRPLAATALLVTFGLTLTSVSAVLGGRGLGWDTAVFNVCAFAVLAAALTRLRQPTYRLALALAVFVGLGVRWFTFPPEPREGQTRERICREVEEHINARTPYGRVFALGYAGLDLLSGYAGERLVPNMDLHVGSLRRAYKGQNLYVLVPRPEGTARAESVFWKHPDIYKHGGDRLLFSGAFGTWHLFEVVTAPTQEQLDEWRRNSE